MTAREILKAAERFVVDNSPGILTGFAVAGTVSTAVMAAKAAVKSDYEFRKIEAVRQVNMTNREIVRLVWKNFIPPAVMLTTTVAAIILANQIGSRRAAAITAAFKLSEKMSEEYREKIVKTLGVKNEEKARSELATEKMSRTPGHESIIVSGSDVVFFDELSGRYFKNELEAVRKAVNEINYQVNNFYCASLSEFYEKIGLPKTMFSDEVGWNSDSLLEVSFSATLLDEGRPAISITYNKTPISGYDRCQ